MQSSTALILIASISPWTLRAQSQILGLISSGTADTDEKATVYVRDLGLFVTALLLEDTSPALSLGQI